MKKYIILILTAFSSATMVGQMQHEFQIVGGGGLSTLHYSLLTGKNKLGFGGEFGLGYGFFFNDNFGVLTGLGVGFYNATANAKGLQTTIPDLNDGDVGNPPLQREFTLNSTLGKYEERQSVTTLNIPLMLQYQTSGNHRFYVRGGLTFAIPVTSKYEVKNGVVDNYAYYPAMDNPTVHGPKLQGYGLFEEVQASDKLPLRTAFLIGAETGMKWKIGKTAALYTGVYADYGLNDMVKERNTTLIRLNEDIPQLSGDFTTNSLLSSRATPKTTITEKVVPLAVGVKLRLTFGFGKKFKETEEEKEKREKKKTEEKAKKEEEAKTLREKFEKIAKADEVLLEEKQKDVEFILSPLDSFPLNVATLNDRQKIRLDEKIALLKKHPDVYITCVGHTDNLGNDDLNFPLGARRADNVRKYMIEHGIPEAQISIISKGKYDPAVENIYGQRMKNRRVEFDLKKEEGEEEFKF